MWFYKNKLHDYDVDLGNYKDNVRVSLLNPKLIK